MPAPDSNTKASELEALLTTKEAAAVLDSILGSTPSGVIIAAAPDGKVLRVSDFAVRLVGRTRDEVEGRTIDEAAKLVPGYEATGRLLATEERPLRRALLGETVSSFEVWVDAASGERIPVASSAAPIRNWRGEVIGSINSIADLRPYKALERDLRQAAAQKETLYQELTHRVKNHLQIMSALVALEARNPEVSARDLGDHIKGQLQTLAAVYQGMDQAEAGARIEARTFIEAVCSPYASDVLSLEATVEPADLTLASEQAGPVGMLVNEAVCNATKHAFPGRGGRIQVSLRRLEPGRLRVEVADDGVGWGQVDPNAASHGLDLMRLFARQLHCDLELGDAPGGGALVAAEMPETDARGGAPTP